MSSFKWPRSKSYSNFSKVGISKSFFNIFYNWEKFFFRHKSRSKWVWKYLLSQTSNARTSCPGQLSLETRWPGLPSWINLSWKSSNFHSIICLTESFKKYCTPFSLLLRLLRSSSPFLGGACFEFGNAAELKFSYFFIYNETIKCHAIEFTNTIMRTTDRLCVIIHFCFGIFKVTKPGRILKKALIWKQSRDCY